MDENEHQPCLMLRTSLFKNCPSLLISYRLHVIYKIDSVYLRLRLISFSNDFYFSKVSVLSQILFLIIISAGTFTAGRASKDLEKSWDATQKFCSLIVCTFLSGTSVKTPLV